MGKDVAVALGYERPTDAARKHIDPEDRGVAKIETPPEPKKMTVIKVTGKGQTYLINKFLGKAV